MKVIIDRKNLETITKPKKNTRIYINETITIKTEITNMYSHLSDNPISFPIQNLELKVHLQEYARSETIHNVHSMFDFKYQTPCL